MGWYRWKPGIIIIALRVRDGWYGQRRRLVQVQAKVVAGPGGVVTYSYVHSYIPLLSHHPRCCRDWAACAAVIAYRERPGSVEQQQQKDSWW